MNVRLNKMKKLPNKENFSVKDRGSTMKAFVLVLFALCILGCEQYPSNPPLEQDADPFIQIVHKATDYVEATSNIPGIAADKTNILLFEFEIANFETVAMEVLGIVTLEGMDEKKEHTIHFYTDQILVEPQGTDYELNTLDKLVPESTYTLIRSKFPPNEYAPFKNDMGRIKTLKFCEVWAYNASGEKQSIVISE